MKLKYLPPLDGIRACAFSLVLISHVGLGDLVPGGMGVTIFFFLSGYLITSLLRAEWSETQHISLPQFYLRRCFRILPPLYLVVAITFLLDLIHIPVHQSTGLGLSSILFYFYNYAALTHLVSPGIPVGLEVAWSLMIEEHFYLLFPLVYLFLLKRSVSKRSTISILLGGCAIALIWRTILVFLFHTSLVSSSMPWTYMATDARFDSILWGCILAIGANPWCGDKVAFFEKHRAKLGAAGLILLLGTVVFREPHFRETFRYTLQGIALFPIFYYVVATPHHWQARWLTWAPLRWVGLVSYTMYLSHFSIFLILRSYIKGHSVVVALLAALLCGLFSEAVRRSVEIPARGFMKKLSQSRAIRAAKRELEPTSP
ncbi:MAG TPA: acyltransferase [Silvibacterium sp.]|jgi:peptidoglycan/LPS O-acetylase OafA/YrhL|nr:acyltransferase [Silvibacterium sp.]